MYQNVGRCTQVFYHVGQPVELPPGTLLCERAYPECCSIPDLAYVDVPALLRTKPPGHRVVIRRTRSLLDSLSTYQTLIHAADRWPNIRFEVVLHPDAECVLPPHPKVYIRPNNCVPEDATGMYLNFVAGFENGPLSGGAMIRGLLDVKAPDEVPEDYFRLLRAKAEEGLGLGDINPEITGPTVKGMESVASLPLSRVPKGGDVLVFRQWGGLGDQVMLGMTVSDLIRQFPDVKVTVAVPREFIPMWAEFPVTCVPAERVTSRYLWKFLHIRDCSTACSEAPILARGEKVTTHRADRWAAHLGFAMKDYRSFYTPRPDERAKAARLVAGPKLVVGISPSSVCTWRRYPHTARLARLLQEAGFRVVGIHSLPLRLPGVEQPVVAGPRELGALVSQLDCLVTVPTSTYCMATVLGVPTVAMFGTEDAVPFKYVAKNAVHLQKSHTSHCPCWGVHAGECLTSDGVTKCLASITPEEIVAAVVAQTRLSRACICGSTNHTRMGRREGMLLTKCQSCATVVSQDLPKDPTAYMKLYQTSEYHTTYQVAVGHKPYSERYAEDTAVAKLRLKRLGKLDPVGPLLDVGCSNGAFVAEATAAGLDAEGFEPNPDISDFARSKGLMVTTAASLSDVGYYANSFGTVTMHDVLEHMLDPEAQLAEVRRLLSKDGLLVVDVPDGDCELARSKGLDYHHIRPREHLYLFSEVALAALLTRCGFQVVDTDRPIPGKLVVYCRVRSGEV